MFHLRRLLRRIAWPYHAYVFKRKYHCCERALQIIRSLYLEIPNGEWAAAGEDF